MTDGLHMQPKHRQVLEALLQEHLPGVEVWAYGSRVSGRSHDGSDLDLVLRGPGLKEIPIARLGDFEEAVRESTLPFLVEARDWTRLPERFHREIERHHVVLAARDGRKLEGKRSGVGGKWSTDRFERLLSEPVRNGIYKRKEFHGRGAKIVNMGELFAHPRLHAVPMKRVELSEFEADRFLIAVGDLLFARRSLVAEGAGKCCVVLNVDEPTTFESSIIRARPDTTKAAYLYLYYFFNSALGLYHLDTIRRQVAVAGITGSDLAKLEIPVPPLNEQRAIAHILGTLDDKIELNRRMNETLEAMARALFKSWFVDFDPVRAKMAGRDPGLPQSLADLFPDRLVNSELGEIPQGWEVGTLGSVADNPRRGVPAKEIDPGTSYIALEHMPKRCIALSEWGSADGVSSGKFEFERGDILFGKLRPYFHKVGIAPLHGVCSTDIVVISPVSHDWFGFVLGHVSSSAFVDYTNAGSIGTKMPRTKWRDMARYQVALPDRALVKAFTVRIQPWVKCIMSSIHESRTLATLRDALLPKLIGGELRVDVDGETV